jgi:hypothetical protein
MLALRPSVEHLAGIASARLLMELLQLSSSFWSASTSSGCFTRPLNMDRIFSQRRMARSKGSMVGSINASAESGVVGSDTILSRTRVAMIHRKRDWRGNLGFGR